MATDPAPDPRKEPPRVDGHEGGAAVPPRRRADSVDVMRGVFILLMTLGFAVPPFLFPDWMYHRQFPSEVFAPLRGLTWRDVTFGGFLMTLAVAIPLTMTARLERGMASGRIVWIALRRAVMLFAFALIIGHASRAFTEVFTLRGQLVSIAGYLLCMVVFTRPPASWGRLARVAVPLAGWAGVVALFLAWPKLFGMPFDPARRDDVIAMLAFAALAGIVVWVATRNDPLARVAVLVGLVCVRLAASESGWAQQLWGFQPLPWLFGWHYLDMMLIVIPGTIAGDAIVRWSRHGEVDSRWSRRRTWSIVALLIVTEPIVVTGLYLRRPGVTLLLMLGIGAGLWWLARAGEGASVVLVRALTRLGFVLLLLGLLLEPFEGGIAKVPGTMSYYLVVGGISLLILVALILVSDVQRVDFPVLQPLAEVGRNSMAAYMLMPMLVLPALELVPGFVAVASSAVSALIRAVLWIFITIGLIGYLSRKRLFWRT